MLEGVRERGGGGIDLRGRGCMTAMKSQETKTVYR